MTARLGRLSLATALSRALELSRNHDYVHVDVIEVPGEDGYRVVWPGKSAHDFGEIRFVAEVRAIRGAQG